MRIAIISDIHSNSEALHAAGEYIRNEGIERTICLGDIVGYGAEPNECCEWIRENVDLALLGNHDAAVIGVMDTDYYYDAAREALFWTRRNLSKENFEWLYSLPYTYRSGNLGFFHSAPVIPSGFYYVVSTGDAEKHLGVLNRLDEFNFCGHSHLTNKFVLSPITAEDASEQDVERRPGHKWIINVGSVGQPRDRDNRACLGVFDTESNTFEHVRLEYDIAATASKIVDVGLNQKFAKRLFAGL